jgi:hypothetical protein
LELFISEFEVVTVVPDPAEMHEAVPLENLQLLILWFPVPAVVKIVIFLTLPSSTDPVMIDPLDPLAEKLNGKSHLSIRSVPPPEKVLAVVEAVLAPVQSLKKIPPDPVESKIFNPDAVMLIDDLSTRINPLPVLSIMSLSDPFNLHE